MLAIFFLPYIVVPLYFLIGIRKREPKQKKEYIKFNHVSELLPYQLDNPNNALQNLLKKNGIPPATKGNSFLLITNGTEAYHKMLKEINAAKYSIDICTYVFQFDKMTEMMLDALRVKAEEGIKVKVLIPEPATTEVLTVSFNIG